MSKHQDSSITHVKVIDLISDTVTKPDIHMRQAMFEAEVGDDGYQEDPTVRLLEEKSSTLFEKEAALFVPSGLMGNLVAMMAHIKDQRGCEVIVGDKSHILLWEQSGAAQFAGLQMREVRNLPDGSLDMSELREKCRPTNPYDYESYTSLICIENTHNYLGGVVVPIEWLDQLGKFVKEKNIPLHMDGARIFNAAIHLGVPVSRIAEHCDSVTFCLSKGLGAPIGAVLLGNKMFIEKCRRIRKSLGGSMRQAGIVAAAGVYALDNCVERLAVDHWHAKKIGNAIHQMASPDVTVNLEKVDTNILIVKLNDMKINSPDFYDMLLKVNNEDDDIPNEINLTSVRISYLYKGCVRFVLHKDISEEDVDMAIEKIKYVIGKIKSSS
ncbi:probable low-specificity L-threonine aldolase 2 [Rhopalosiphum maidis]|uniref:probable low-specificity L-threonine aldolase 2 n=1 Tax=Rhopalosiphum maidis TaxID=43146 RepID=UPI000EFED511|nr:probable low-specificity L-threonine aldolase 2 [Rhopalosiphum maidis]